MLTGKQRSYLKGLANGIDPVVYIGKDQLTENVIKEIDKYISVHELVKCKLQEGADLDPKATANEAAKALGAEFVQAIGRKFVLYRRAEKEEDREIVLPR